MIVNKRTKFTLHTTEPSQMHFTTVHSIIFLPKCTSLMYIQFILALTGSNLEDEVELKCKLKHNEVIDIL